MEPIDVMFIYKSDVPDFIDFENHLMLHNCRLASSDNPFYKIEGKKEDIESFRQYWADYTNKQYRRTHAFNM